MPRLAPLATHASFLLALLLAAQAAPAADSQVRLNTVGFLPDREKRASVAAPASDFAILDEAGDVVLRGKTTGPRRNDDTRENLYVADFSALGAAPPEHPHDRARWGRRARPTGATTRRTTR